MSQQSEGGCFGKASVTRYSFCNEKEEKKKETNQKISDDNNSNN
tara:strand:- start:739 stop:870 length:132 start_codon:yes stop_codon:yes gene_type:complete